MTFLLVSTAVLATVMLGCASTARDRAGRSDAAEFERLRTAERARQMLLGADYGLEVREWIIEADTELIGRRLMEFRVELPLSAELEHHLRRNGLRLVMVRVDELDELESALGYASLNRRGWYGQIVEWMQIHGYRSGGAHAGVFVDGRAQRFDAGAFRLMARAWMLPMEDGPHLNLQILPERLDSFHRRLPESQRLARLRPEHERRGEPITSNALDLLIPHGYALILTGEDPGVDWQEATNGASREPDQRSEVGGQRSELRGRRAEADGRQPNYGPVVDVPPTLGEMLFMIGNVRGGRGMLIFVPRVPEELLPSELTQSAANEAVLRSRRSAHPLTRSPFNRLHLLTHTLGMHL